MKPGPKGSRCWDMLGAEEPGTLGLKFLRGDFVARGWGGGSLSLLSRLALEQLSVRLLRRCMAKGGALGRVSRNDFLPAVELVVPLLPVGTRCTDVGSTSVVPCNILAISSSKSLFVVASYSISVRSATEVGHPVLNGTVKGVRRSRRPGASLERVSFWALLRLSDLFRVSRMAQLFS